MNIKWDTKDYSEKFDFVHRYGNDVIELMELPRGSFVVDLGCGNGALSYRLALKGYNVLGIDASEDMLKIAAESYPHIDFRKDDAVEFCLDKKADGIFSNAVFHWIDNQQALVKNINRQLRTGGELVFEFGGKNCAEAVHGALERKFGEMGLKYPRVFYFPTISEYSKILEENGFLVKFAVLFERPTPQKGEHGIIDWINMFVKKPFENMDNALAERIKQETEKELKDRLFINQKWYVDYVRIRMRAVKIEEV